MIEKEEWYAADQPVDSPYRNACNVDIFFW